MDFGFSQGGIFIDSTDVFAIFLWVNGKHANDVKNLHKSVWDVGQNDSNLDVLYKKICTRTRPTN